MYPSTLGTFGSPKKNARKQSNPQTDITQGDWNPLVNCVAQMTQVTHKMWAHFQTATSGSSIVCTGYGAQWGSGSANTPTIARVGTGHYTVSTPASWASPGSYTYSLDPDGVVITTEQVIFVDSFASVDQAEGTPDAGSYCKTSRNQFTVNVYVYNSSHALSDLGGGIPIRVEAR